MPAGCVKSAASKVGGPSLAGVCGEPGTLTCHQVTAAATDVLHEDHREGDRAPHRPQGRLGGEQADRHGQS
ncbi:hypothetical protein DN051_39915 [Streptomyces cadmiisoli]|uniref:Uncharacterized protein n=1 Tax=Streptomyces cadmiisoli TaxID=2184053 RepID=A0A2Z4JAC1_9ACTN|nr:hypothetical protein DN051_39915 [Streptomyces cadmiisoli]